MEPLERHCLEIMKLVSAMRAMHVEHIRAEMGNAPEPKIARLEPCHSLIDELAALLEILPTVLADADPEGDLAKRTTRLVKRVGKMGPQWSASYMGLTVPSGNALVDGINDAYDSVAAWLTGVEIGQPPAAAHGGAVAAEDVVLNAFDAAWSMVLESTQAAGDLRDRRELADVMFMCGLVQLVRERGVDDARELLGERFQSLSTFEEWWRRVEDNAGARSHGFSRLQ